MYTTYPEFIDADHGHEIPSVFGEPLLGRMVAEDVWPEGDKCVSKLMMELWAGFARNG